MPHPTTPDLAHHDYLNEAHDERYAVQIRSAAEISLAIARWDYLNTRLGKLDLADPLGAWPHSMIETGVLEEVAGFAAYGSDVHLYTMGAANEAAFLRRHTRGLVVDAFGWVR